MGVLLRAFLYELHADPWRIKDMVTGPSAQNFAEENPSAVVPLGMERISNDWCSSSHDPQVDEDEGVDGRLTCQATKPGERPAGAVVLLACDVLGGRLRTDQATATEMTLRVSIGSASNEQKCVEAAKADVETFAEK